MLFILAGKLASFHQLHLTVFFREHLKKTDCRDQAVSAQHFFLSPDNCLLKLSASY